MKLFVEIEPELKELKLNKIYLFDPKFAKISNGHSSILPFETVQLYDKLERCSALPPRPIPFNLKRKDINRIDR